MLHKLHGRKSCFHFSENPCQGLALKNGNKRFHKSIIKCVEDNFSRLKWKITKENSFKAAQFITKKRAKALWQSKVSKGWKLNVDVVFALLSIQQILVTKSQWDHPLHPKLVETQNRLALVQLFFFSRKIETEHSFATSVQSAIAFHSSRMRKILGDESSENKQKENK